MCKETVCMVKREKWNECQRIYIPRGEKEHEAFIKKFMQREAKVTIERHLSHKRQNERGISDSDIFDILINGWVIERNTDSGKKALVILGYTKNYRPLHLVINMVKKNEWVAVTAYDPRTHSWKWNDSYDERICFCEKGEGSYE